VVRRVVVFLTTTSTLLTRKPHFTWENFFDLHQSLTLLLISLCPPTEV